MNAFKLSLLFLAAIAVLNLRQPEPRRFMKMVELKQGAVIEETGALVIPTLLKSDAPVLYPEREGVLTLRVRGVRFTYLRSPEVKRNEYRLKTAMISELSVEKGDKIELDFRRSNMVESEKFNALLKVGKL